MNEVPARLFVGQNHDLVVQAVEDTLRSYLCENKIDSQKKAYCTCRSCRQMKQRQHASISWLSPEKDYAVKDIDVIFEKICFALENNEHFFFVLEKADTLSAVVANKLLKVIEEPPRGYHFLLLTSNEKMIIQTILSRCLLVPIAQPNDSGAASYMPFLLTFFQDAKKLADPVPFEQELRKQKLTDTESEALLQELITFFSQELRSLYKDGVVFDQEKNVWLCQVIDFLHEKMLKPPQSGSSDIFWKYLYLTFPRMPNRGL